MGVAKIKKNLNNNVAPFIAVFLGTVSSGAASWKLDGKLEVSGLQTESHFKCAALTVNRVV